MAAQSVLFRHVYVSGITPSLTALDFQCAVLFVQWVPAQVHHAGRRGGDPESHIEKNRSDTRGITDSLTHWPQAANQLLRNLNASFWMFDSGGTKVTPTDRPIKNLPSWIQVQQPISSQLRLKWTRSVNKQRANVLINLSFHLLHFDLKEIKDEWVLISFGLQSKVNQGWKYVQKSFFWFIVTTFRQNNLTVNIFYICLNSKINVLFYLTHKTHQRIIIIFQRNN